MQTSFLGSFIGESVLVATAVHGGAEGVVVYDGSDVLWYPATGRARPSVPMKLMRSIKAAAFSELSIQSYSLNSTARRFALVNMLKSRVHFRADAPAYPFLPPDQHAHHVHSPSRCICSLLQPNLECFLPNHRTTGSSSFAPSGRIDIQGSERRFQNICLAELGCWSKSSRSS